MIVLRFVAGNAEVWFPLLNGGVIHLKDAFAVEQLPVKMAVLPLQMVILSAVIVGMAGLGLTVSVNTAEGSLVQPSTVTVTL